MAQAHRIHGAEWHRAATRGTGGRLQEGDTADRVWPDFDGVPALRRAPAPRPHLDLLARFQGSGVELDGAMPPGTARRRHDRQTRDDRYAGARRHPDKLRRPGIAREGYSHRVSYRAATRHQYRDSLVAMLTDT